MTRNHGQAPSDLIRNCLITDGAGWSPDALDEVAIKITEELEIGPEPWHGPSIIIGPDVVTDLVIQGHTQTTGTRLMGGGFGLVGAAQGMVAANLVNSLTRRVTTWTLVKVETCDGFTTIQIDLPEARVRHLLRPFRDAIFAAKGDAAASPEGGSVIDNLERLAALRDSGAIDEGEFRAAKSQILGT